MSSCPAKLVLMRHWVLVLVAGCVGSETVVCDDGTTCPAATKCATVATRPGAGQFWVRDDEIGCTSGESCAAGAGTCHDGVCFENDCGNALVDLGEACDDGATTSGDGCSADCQSKEVCGNTIVDPVAGEACDAA